MSLGWVSKKQSWGKEHKQALTYLLEKRVKSNLLCFKKSALTHKRNTTHCSLQSTSVCLLNATVQGAGEASGALPILCCHWEAQGLLLRANGGGQFQAENAEIMWSGQGKNTWKIISPSLWSFFVSRTSFSLSYRSFLI